MMLRFETQRDYLKCRSDTREAIILDSWGGGGAPAFVAYRARQLPLGESLALSAHSKHSCSLRHITFVNP